MAHLIARSNAEYIEKNESNFHINYRCLLLSQFPLGI
jgi:hypothetical protein